MQSHHAKPHNIFLIKKILPEYIEKKTLIISVIMGFYILGWSFGTPLFGIYMYHIIGSNSFVGIIFSLLPLMGIIFSLPIGKLADRVNKAKLLYMGFFAYILVSLGYIYSWIDHSFIIITRVVHGVVVLVVWIAAESLLRISTKKTEVAFCVYHFIQKGMYVLGGIFLVILLYFELITISNLYMIFVFLFLFLIVTALLTPVLLKISNVFKNHLAKGVFEVVEKDHFIVSEIKDILKFDVNVRSMMIMSFAFTMFTTSLALFFPIMVYQMNFALWQIILVMLMPEILFILLPQVPRFVKKFGDTRMLTFFVIIAVASGLCIAFAKDLFPFLCFYTLAIGAHNLAVPIINNIITYKIKKSDYGEITGAITMSNKTGGLIGAIGTGILADIFSYSFSFILFSIILFVIAFISIRYYKKMRLNNK